MPVGCGEIPIARILSTFMDSYQGALMVEFRRRYFRHVEESKKNLENMLAFILLSSPNLPPKTCARMALAAS